MVKATRRADRGAAKMRGDGAIRPRVLHVITGLGRGGAEQMLLKALPRMENENVVCSLTDRDEVGRLLRERGIRVHRLGLRRWNLPALILRFRRVIRQERPVIINSYLLHTNLFSRVFGRLFGVPIIICSVRNIHRDRPFWNWLDKRTQGLVDAYTPNSESVRRFLVEELRLPPGKITVIPNCVDEQRIRERVAGTDRRAKRAALGITENEFVITYVASFKAQKDHATLLEAFALLGGSLRRSARLLLVGDGELRNGMERLARHLGIARRVLFLGERDDVVEILAITDCFAFPTLHEGMPNALLEAAAAGVPIVCTDIPENREVVGEEALFFPRRDPSALARAVRRTMRDRAGAKRFAERARLRVKEKFFVWATTRRLSEAYRRLFDGD